MSEIVQGSQEWLQLRCGLATASEFSSVLASGKGGAPSITRAAYLNRIVAERLTGEPQISQATGKWLKDLERGKEQEPLARMAYEAKTGAYVEEVPFIKHQTLECGCSPDGLIDLDGGAEIKSVIPTVQLATWESGSYPTEHRAQVQGSLWITGRTYWDYCSYSPTLPPNLRLYVFRVLRDEVYISQLAAAVKQFLTEVEAKVLKYQEMK